MPISDEMTVTSCDFWVILEAAPVFLSMGSSTGFAPGFPAEELQKNLAMPSSEIPFLTRQNQTREHSRALALCHSFVAMAFVD